MIVTGAGRSGGIGASICRAFADQGCNLFFSTYSSYDRRISPKDPGGPSELAEELRRTATEPLFAEAVFLSNPDMYQVSIEPLISKPRAGAYVPSRTTASRIDMLRA